MDPKFIGVIRRGDFVPDRPKVFYAFLRGMEGKRVECIIRPPQNPKTLQQLRYFHGVVCKCISDNTGYTVDEVKGLLKGHFLVEYIKGPAGKEIPIVPSLADLKKLKMSEFIDNCIRLAAEHWHIVIPAPDEVVY